MVLDGMDKLLLDICKVYDIEGEAEEALTKHANMLKGKTISLVGSYTGGFGADLIKYCGRNCKLVTLKLKTGSNFDMLLSEEAKNMIAEMWRDFCSRYGSDPEILIEPTLEEELKALKKIKPDLVIPPAFFGTGPDLYEKHGFKTLVPNRLAGYFFRMGYWTVIDAAIEARRALERPCSSTPLLPMIEQDEEYGGLSNYWGDNARVFRDVWYEANLDI